MKGPPYATMDSLAKRCLQTLRPMTLERAHKYLFDVCTLFDDSAPNEGWGERKEWRMPDGSVVNYDGRGFTAREVKS